MSAFILECLYSTGWRRAGDLYWQLSDAKSEANKRVQTGRARACRVLPVTVQLEALYSIQQEHARV